MAKEAGERFATVAEFVEAINCDPLVLTDVGSGSRPPPRSSRSLSRPRRMFGCVPKMRRKM